MAKVGFLKGLNRLKVLHLEIQTGHAGERANLVSILFHIDLVVTGAV